MSDRSAPTSDDDQRRADIADLLQSGLDTEVRPRAETPELVNETIARLQALPDGELNARLVVAGFTNHVIEVEEIEQSCETCMYYLVHRKYCDLPELDLPVEPQWSCRLWRI